MEAIYQYQYQYQYLYIYIPTLMSCSKYFPNFLINFLKHQIFAIYYYLNLKLSENVKHVSNRLIIFSSQFFIDNL